MQRRLDYPPVQHPNELLEPLEKRIINIDTEALVIQQNWGEWLKPPEAGLYMAGGMRPTVRADRQYTDRNGVMILDINNIQHFFDTLFHTDGKVAVPRFVMEDKKRFLKTNPTQPNTAYQLIASIVERSIAQINPWRNNLTRGDRVMSFLKPGGEDLVNDINYIPAIVANILSEVVHFIGEDVWNFYNVTLVGTGLVLEKSVDYRVYEWTRMVYELQNPESSD